MLELPSKPIERKETITLHDDDIKEALEAYYQLLNPDCQINVEVELSCSGCSIEAEAKIVVYKYLDIRVE